MAQLQGRLILVIDDDPKSRSLLTEQIEGFGCRVVTASDGREGVRLARENSPDLITLDLLMPEQDGWSVLKELEADPNLREIPVVVARVVPAEGRGSVVGAVELLSKPVSRDDIGRVLRTHLRPHNGTVLVVEDDPSTRALLEAYIEEEASEVRTAADGREAIAILENFTPDLILLDLMMPVMDGVAFMDATRDDPRIAHIPVVVVTAKDLSAADVHGVETRVELVAREGGSLENDVRQIAHDILHTLLAR